MSPYRKDVYKRQILLGEKISLRFVVGAIIVMLSFFVTEGLGSKKKEEAATAEVE